MKKVLKNIVKVLIFFLAWAICVSIGEIDSDNPAVWRFWAEVIPLLWTLLLTIIFLCIERGKVKIPIFHNIAKGSLTGFVTGILWIGISAGILILAGVQQITFENNVEYLWLWILSAGFVITVIISACIGNGSFYPVTAQLIESMGNELNAVILQTVYAE